MSMRISSLSRLIPLRALLALILAGALSACTAVVPPTSATPTSVTPTPAAEAPAGPMDVLPQGGGPGGENNFASVDPTVADLAYAELSPAQKLDLYLPTSGAGPFPVVIMVHGGGFMFGDKADGAGLTGVDQLLEAGYAVASINYRLSGEAQWPAQIQDSKAAVRYLRAVADEYNLDPARIGAWGASAGGTLVSLLGTTCGVAELEGAELGNADRSSCVQAVVDWFGPIDFLAMDAQFAGTECAQNHDAAESPESRLVGAPIQTVPAVVATTNAMNYVDDADAPFFIQHGSADCNVPPAQGQNLADALGADQATFTLIDGAGHGGAEFATPENLQQIIGFFDQHLQ